MKTLFHPNNFPYTFYVGPTAQVKGVWQEGGRWKKQPKENDSTKIEIFLTPRFLRPARHTHRDLALKFFTMNQSSTLIMHSFQICKPPRSVPNRPCRDPSKSQINHQSAVEGFHLRSPYHQSHIEKTTCREGSEDQGEASTAQSRREALPFYTVCCFPHLRCQHYTLPRRRRTQTLPRMRILAQWQPPCIHDGDTALILPRRLQQPGRWGGAAAGLLATRVP